MTKETAPNPDQYRRGIKRYRLFALLSMIFLAGISPLSSPRDVVAAPLCGQRADTANATVTNGVIAADQGADGVFGGYSYNCAMEVQPRSETIDHMNCLN